MLKAGILYRTCDFLEFINSNSVTKNDVVQSFKDFHGVNIEDILFTATSCDWLKTDLNNKLVLTAAGEEILSNEDPFVRLQVQVMHVLEKTNPFWLSTLAQGKLALKKYIKAEELQCLNESGLLDKHDEDIVDWWDSIVARYRGLSSRNLTKIGRKGERLSIEYEFIRTGVKPLWVSLQSDTLGYDIISQVSSDERKQLLIEVKTSSMNWENAKFFLSRNEWEILSVAQYSVLHLWSISKNPPEQAIISLKDVSNHVPLDQGNGNWKKFNCPFNAFNANSSL